MIDAYTIGVRLALSDEISAGLKTVRRELVGLDRAVTVSGAGLRALGQIGVEIGPQARAGVEASGTGRARPARPTAPAAVRGGTVPAATAAAAEPMRRPRANPASAGFPLETAMSLARRIVGTGRGAPPMLPPPPRVAVTAMAVSAAGHRAMTTPVAQRPTSKPQPVSLGAHPAPTTRSNTAAERPRPMSRSGPGPGVPGFAGPRHAPEPSATREAARGPRTNAPGGAQPARRGAPVAPENFAALARRLLAGGALSVPAMAPQTPAVRLAAQPAPGSQSAAVTRRLGNGLVQRPILPRAWDRSRDERGVAPRPAADARPNAPSAPGRQPAGMGRPLLATALAQPRAPSLGRPTASGPMRRHQAPAPPGSDPDSAPASRANGGEIVLDGVRFGRLMAERLARHLDRPRAGFTGMDPRATPTWPGVSIG